MSLIITSSHGYRLQLLAAFGQLGCMQPLCAALISYLAHLTIFLAPACCTGLCTCPDMTQGWLAGIAPVMSHGMSTGPGTE